MQRKTGVIHCPYTSPIGAAHVGVTVGRIIKMSNSKACTALCISALAALSFVLSARRQAIAGFTAGNCGFQNA